MILKAIDLEEFLDRLFDENWIIIWQLGDF